MRLISTLFVAAAAFAAGPEQLDLYPQARGIIQAAERDSLHISMLDDRSRPVEWAAHLYARAGYLEEAAQAYSRSSDSPMTLIKARVVYGDLPGAEKAIAAIVPPEQRLNAEMSVADVLWKMRQAGKAHDFVEAARKTAANITNPTLRARLTASIEQTAKYMNDDPPNPLSARPTPPLRADPDASGFPQFPITTEGFGLRNPKDTGSQASADNELMTRIYQCIGAKDRECLVRILQNAATPFQKTLAIASVEHLFIQASQPKMAEQYATTIPEADPECVLAKAEAMNSAAAAWLRIGNPDQAHTDFGAARKLAESAPKLRFGQLSVMVSIAAAQAKGGMTASSEESLQVAEQLALELPARPPFSPGKSPPPHIEHYRDEAYRQLFAAAIRAHNLGVARRVAERWKTMDKRSSIDIVDAWTFAGKPEEAIAFARSIENTPERVKTQLALAQRLLDQAGAPNF